MNPIKVALETELAYRAAGAATFLLYDARTWAWWHFIAWVAFLNVALEIISRVAFWSGSVWTMDRLKRRGKHLDALTNKDFVFISFGKVGVTVLTYHVLQYTWMSTTVPWKPSELTILNTLVATAALFVVYDLQYTLFHRFLHLRWMYGYVHKHHHRQMAPTRGNIDAINVHPFELVVGEYIHLTAIVIVSQLLFPVHIAAVLAFFITAAFLASLNHTRFDVMLSVVYQVRNHDVHHWFPDCNYGNYTMLWDYFMGTFKPYPDDGGVHKANHVKKAA